MSQTVVVVTLHHIVEDIYFELHEAIARKGASSFVSSQLLNREAESEAGILVLKMENQEIERSADSSSWCNKQVRYAVVTGANKGIGFSICKLLASNGITVVVTARDQKRGLEAVEKLEELGLSGHVVFHQLDVTDSATIPPLADFIRTQFGKLDILVNNAGISGLTVDGDALAASGIEEKGPQGVDWSKIVKEYDQSAEPTIKTNYYGPKETSEALIPLLQLSDSPRIVNVSATVGRLEFIPDGWAKEVLSDIESLATEKVDDILNQFVEDFKEGSLETKGWPTHLSAYAVSKAALNAYTRILAKKYPSFIVNAVCPGHVKTELSYNSGKFTPDEGAECVVKLALLPNGSSSGLFFCRSEVRPF